MIAILEIFGAIFGAMVLVTYLIQLSYIISEMLSIEHYVEKERITIRKILYCLIPIVPTLEFCYIVIKDFIDSISKLKW